MALIRVLPATFEFLNPLSDALSDIEVTDLAGKLRDGKTDSEGIQLSSVAIDTNIVLVNIGWQPNDVLAQMVNNINAGQPFLIGIDAEFRAESRARAFKDKDSLLADAFSRVKQLVLVNKLHFSPETNACDTVFNPIPAFRQYATTAYANLITENDANKPMTSRDITPQEKFGDSSLLSFPVLISQRLDKNKTAKFIARNNATEVINYTRRQDDYLVLDVADVYDMAPEEALATFRGKTVLMGFMGGDISGADKSAVDKFFTPMNPVYAGKAYPDMYGVVIHANVISMILEQNFIDEMPDFMAIITGVLICLLNMTYFMYVHLYKSQWYDLITKSIQFAESIVLIFVIVIVFDKFHYKLDLTVGLAALLLSGDLLEVYTTLTRNLFGMKERNDNFTS